MSAAPPRGELSEQLVPAVPARGELSERLTVVVVTRNRRRELLHTLAQLRALPERPPIVVVDNGSDDGTAADLAAANDELLVVALERDHGSAARNIGVERTCTPYVAFCDDDSWWAPGALSQAASLLDEHACIGLIAARVEVGEERRLDPTCAAMRKSPLTSRHASAPGRPVLGFLACAAVARRKAFLQAGGFHSQLGIGGEEQLLAVDLATQGWSVVYVDELLAHHHPSARRDAHRRSVVVQRNALWFDWMRRPATVALAATLEAAGRALRDASARQALLESARGLPWAVRRRRPLPAHVNRDLCLLSSCSEAQRGRDAAHRTELGTVAQSQHLG